MTVGELRLGSCNQPRPKGRSFRRHVKHGLDFEQIAAKHGIKLLDASTFDEKTIKAFYTNQSCCAGNDRIFLGVYDDEDLKVASFFHELGHCLDQEPDPEFPDCLPFALKSDRELRAWKVGFKIAEEQYGVRFSSATLGWCLDQVRTHLHWRG